MLLPVTYIATYLRGIDATTRQTLLDETGIAAEDLDRADGHAPFELIIALMTVLNQQLAEGWHIQMASRLETVHHGPLGLAAVTAPTLDDCLDILVRGLQTRAPFVWATREHRQQLAGLCLYETPGLGAVNDLLLESALLSFEPIIRTVRGRSSDRIALQLPKRRQHLKSMVEEVFPGSVRSRGHHYRLEFPAPWLSEPSVVRDQTMHRFALSRCEELLQTVARRSSLEVEVREAILKSENGHPGLQKVADQLMLSKRTLIRRLKSHGTSYREILQEVQASLAEEMLLNTRLSVAEIAWRLGFQDAANFGRAFRSWHNQSPGAFRKAGRGSV